MTEETSPLDQIVTDALAEEGYVLESSSSEEEGTTVLNFIKDFGNGIRYQIEAVLKSGLLSLSGLVREKKLIFATDITIRRDVILMTIDRARSVIKAERDASHRLKAVQQPLPPENPPALSADERPSECELAD